MLAAFFLMHPRISLSFLAKGHIAILRPVTGSPRSFSTEFVSSRSAHNLHVKLYLSGVGLYTCSCGTSSSSSPPKFPVLLCGMLDFYTWKLYLETCLCWRIQTVNILHFERTLPNDSLSTRNSEKVSSRLLFDHSWWSGWRNIKKNWVPFFLAHASSSTQLSKLIEPHYRSSVVFNALPPLWLMVCPMNNVRIQVRSFSHRVALCWHKRKKKKKKSLCGIWPGPELFLLKTAVLPTLVVLHVVLHSHRVRIRRLITLS